MADRFYFTALFEFTEKRRSKVKSTYHFTLMPLVICTPVLVILAVLIPYICFKNLEKQSVIERLREAD